MVLALFGSLLLAAQAQAAPATIADAAWLTGCWEFAQATRTVRESWTPPAGGTMLATSRTVSGEKTLDYEFILLRESPLGLQYVAKPSRQPEAVFTSTRVSSDELVFENPLHDFPTKVSYVRQGDDGLLASITGTIGGQEKRVEFPYRAVPCK